MKILKKVLAFMLIMILSITNIGGIKTAKAEEVKKAYKNIGIGTGDYIDYDIDFSAYKAVKILKVYAYISSEKKIDITSAVTHIIENLQRYGKIKALKVPDKDKTYPNIIIQNGIIK